MFWAIDHIWKYKIIKKKLYLHLKTNCKIYSLKNPKFGILIKNILC
jgi:hypothetical protein